MNTSKFRLPGTTLRALALALGITGVGTAQSTLPDLTQPGAIAALKTNGDATPVYGDTFNLGPTGLRGWIGLSSYPGFDYVASGRLTDPSRQILVTAVATPGNAVLAVDDVILGALAANSGTVPMFTSDARKAFGTAITNAEKTGAGSLRVKRWRANVEEDVNITIPTIGEYSATAPYNCPKSSAILASTRDQMVGELLANPNYLDSTQSGAINALALLASVPYVVNPGDPNESSYSQVRTRLQSYARSLTVPAYEWGIDQETQIWHPAYQLIFLSEYYFLTNDSQVVPTINGITLWLSEFQSMWGTFNHGPGTLLEDGSGRRFASGYGPVNAIGIPANVAIVLGKMALLAANQPIDPKIDVAIQRGAGFMGSHVNKGNIQYGEHFPHAGSHASNGKDSAAAVFFGLQADRAVETEYFSRLSIAGWVGLELGHTGQQWAQIWTILGAGMGGETAASEHFKQLLWRYDIHRRTNGSFTYDSRGLDYYGGSTTSDGTYLGDSAASGVNGSAIHLLAYSLPLKQLHITGKSLNPAYTLDSIEVANAVSAGYFSVDRANLSVAQLFTFLGHYDPVVRSNASVELAAETLSSADLANLRGLLASPDPNIRQSAAETLGIRKDATALPTLVGMLHGPNRDSHHWVRQKVAAAIRQYNASTVSTHRDALITAFIANAPADPDVIDWADPLQFSNSTLSEVLFNQLAGYTINAPKETHLYPALRAGLLLPAGAYRSTVAQFARNRLNLTDLQNIFPELAEVASFGTPADRMFSAGTRANALAFMVENKISEGIEIAFAMLNDPNGFPWGAHIYNLEALRALAAYGDAARYTLPRLREVRDAWAAHWWYGTTDGAPILAQINDTITFLENSTTAPATNLGKCVATPQIVTTTGAKAITLTGLSPRGSFSFLDVTQPANGTLSGTAPNLTYTPNGGFSGTDKFTFRTKDSLTTSDPAMIVIVVGSSGTGIVGTYFNNANFTSPVLTRIDPQINFDWGTGSPAPSIGADSFSTRWSGFLLAPETGTYSLSSLASDGVRAYLNGVPVINNFNEQSTRWTDGQSISLTAGQKVPLLLEYYESTGSAVAKLKWTGPSFAGLNGDIIPQAYLFENNSSGGADTTAPMISALFPAVNATQLAPDTVLVATFSENILPGTGNITIKNLSDGSQTVIPVTDSAHVTISGATMVITPPAFLLSGNSYAIQIASTAIRDASGNNFAGITNDTTWNFTTYKSIINVDLNADGVNQSTVSNPSYGIWTEGPNYWNTIGTASTTTPLVDSSNTPTPITFEISGSQGAASNWTGGNNDSLVVDGRWTYEGGVMNTMIAGLQVNTTYKLLVYHADDYVSESVTVNGVAAEDFAGSLGSTGYLDAFDGITDSDFWYFSSVNTGPAGVLNIASAGSGGNGYNTITGFQLEKVGASSPDTTQPYISTFNPADNATGVAADANLVATFSENIVKGTGNITIRNLTDGIQTTIPVTDAQVTVSGATLTINPTADLSGDKNYAIQIAPTAIVDTTGINFAGISDDRIWSFTTAGDTNPPVITSYSPADEATGVFQGGFLTATFNEPISVGTGNITIRNLTDSTQTTVAVTDTAKVTISGTTLTIKPTAILRASKNYAIQIAATAIDDTAGNSFAGITDDTTWNFTTSDGIPTPPPVTNGMIVWLPADGVDTGDTNQVRTDGSDLYVKQWNDFSTAANKHATNATEADQPLYIAYGLNGKPVLRFAQDNDEENGDRLYLGDLSENFPTGASVFIVSTIDNDGRYNLFGNRSNDDRFVADTWNEAVPGSFRGGRATFPYSSVPQNGSHLFLMESDSTQYEILINGASIGTASADYNSGAGLNWTIGNRAASGQQLRGDIAEVILYNRVLTAAEAGLVGSYLTSKYGLASSYDPAPVISTYNPADNATGVAVGANLVATFNESITIGTGDITLKNLTDGAQSTIAVTDTTQVSISGSVLTINPTVDLTAGKNYAIQIAATAIKDLADNAFVGIGDDTTWNFSTEAASGSYQAGLWYGTVAGNINTADANPKTSVTVDLSQTEDAIADNTTEIYTGQIYDADGQISFTEDIDDKTRLYIDGTLVLSSDGWSDRVSTANLNLTPGWHEFELRISNGTGGSGPYTSPGFGYDPNGGTNWAHPSDPGDGSLFRSTLPGGTALVVSSFNPLDNATGVDVTANLVATFSAPIARGTGDITLKNLTDGTQTTIAVIDTTQVSISGAVLTINPTADFLFNKNYAVQIAATAIDDTAGTSFAGISDDTTWNFATAASDTTVPTITNRNPADNATGVAVDANLVATFSENIVGVSGNITLRTTSNNQVVATIAVTDTAQVSISGNVLTINPTADLLPNTSYAVRIQSTCIDDTAGNSFAGISSSTNWNFTTATPDTTAPTPDPLTFATPPAALGQTSITMSATTASDPSGVEYFFECTAGGGHSSAWQDSPTYTDTGLTAATQYSYRVRARDKSVAQTATAWSAAASATTAPDTTAPTPDPLTFATPPAALGQTSITMTATTASDPSGVEYFFECTTSGGHSSAWQDSPTYTDTGLTAATQYSYRVRARDKSAAQTATAWSATTSATTAPDTTAPTPDPLTFATPPTALGQTSITMTATTASDPSGVEYFFECTTSGGHSSAWQDSPTYTDTGLTAAIQYSYRVRARDKSVAQTATAWSAAASATTSNTPYGNWSGGVSFDADTNNDGVDNGMAWLLGASHHNENAADKLPKATHNGTHLRLTFRCLKSTMRDGVVLKVQTSSDLGVSNPWTNNEAAVPDEDATVNGVVFDTTADGDYIHVIADIPAAGPGLFARLYSTEP